MVYSFRKMFFIFQYLKHVHMTYSFLELLIFFCLEFISHHTKEILYVNTNFMGNQSWNTNHELVSNIDVEKTCFFNVKLKLLFFFFFSVWVFFSFTNIHDSQDNRGRGGYIFNSSLPFPPASHTRLARWLLQRAHICT